MCRPCLTPPGENRFGSDTQRFASSVVYFNGSGFPWEISCTIIAGSTICTFKELPPKPRPNWDGAIEGSGSLPTASSAELWLGFEPLAENKGAGSDAAGESWGLGSFVLHWGVGTTRASLFLSPACGPVSSGSAGAAATGSLLRLAIACRGGATNWVCSFVEGKDRRAQLFPGGRGRP